MAGFGVLLECRHHRADAAAADEGHHDVDAVGGLGFVEGAPAGVELRADLLQPRFQGLGDEFFVEATREGRHSWGL